MLHPPKQRILCISSTTKKKKKKEKTILDITDKQVIGQVLKKIIQQNTTEKHPNC